MKLSADMRVAFVAMTATMTEELLVQCQRMTADWFDLPK
jgi:hypothetical protein